LKRLHLGQFLDNVGNTLAGDSTLLLLGEVVVEGGNVGHNGALVWLLHGDIGGIEQSQDTELVLSGGKGVVEIGNPVLRLQKEKEERKCEEKEEKKKRKKKGKGKKPEGHRNQSDLGGGRE